MARPNQTSRKTQDLISSRTFQIPLNEVRRADYFPARLGMTRTKRDTKSGKWKHLIPDSVELIGLVPVLKWNLKELKKQL